jgi:hypothetical protein
MWEKRETIKRFCCSRKNSEDTGEVLMGEQRKMKKHFV